eukprot:scaffold120505_cov15-Tisochrysis_lutea.AAC.1
MACALIRIGDKGTSYVVFASVQYGHAERPVMVGVKGITGCRKAQAKRIANVLLISCGLGHLHEATLETEGQSSMMRVYLVLVSCGDG